MSAYIFCVVDSALDRSISSRTDVERKILAELHQVHLLRSSHILGWTSCSSPVFVSPRMSFGSFDDRQLATAPPLPEKSLVQRMPQTNVWKRA